MPARRVDAPSHSTFLPLYFSGAAQVNRFALPRFVAVWNRSRRRFVEPVTFRESTPCGSL